MYIWDEAASPSYNDTWQETYFDKDQLLKGMVRYLSETPLQHFEDQMDDYDFYVLYQMQMNGFSDLFIRSICKLCCDFAYK